MINIETIILFVSIACYMIYVFLWMNQGLVLCCASSEAYLGPYETSMIGLFYETIHKKSIVRRFPACIYLLKVNNRNTRTRCEICSKLTVNTPWRSHWRPSGVFIVNFEHISHLVLVFRLLTLSILLLGDTLLQSMSFGNRTNLGAK